MIGPSLSGRVHSIQSLGTLDGPGVRFVVFLQGCPLRCKCCHNPDTWALDGGSAYTPEELVRRALRYKEYFGTEGGVTLSGGEPLLQAEFAKEFFRFSKEAGLHTCLDTSGCILSSEVKALLDVTDRVLLDVKYTTEKAYRENVGCSMSAPLAFLEELTKKRIPVTLRQVIIPSVNDDKEQILRLKEIVDTHPVIDKVELLPFRKICRVKYDNMGIPFPFGHLPEPTAEDMRRLEELL